MPRRYPDYLPTDGFTTLNTISTIGSSSPPPRHNFTSLPRIRSERSAFDCTTLTWRPDSAAELTRIPLAPVAGSRIRRPPDHRTWQRHGPARITPTTVRDRLASSQDDSQDDPPEEGRNNDQLAGVRVRRRIRRPRRDLAGAARETLDLAVMDWKTAATPAVPAREAPLSEYERNALDNLEQQFSRPWWMQPSHRRSPPTTTGHDSVVPGGTRPP